MHRNKSVNVHQFAMIPKADIPRSQFRRQFTHKTTFDAGYLVPVYVDEVLPGDTFNMQCTFFARMATPIYPIMDNLYLDSMFFFFPLRLLWSNFRKFMGEQANPGDSISYTIPQMVSPAGGYAVGSLQDYMGLPTVGQVGAQATVSHSALFTRAYNLLYNEWIRSQDLQDSVVVDLDDGPDDPADYVLLRRGKRHDYFTACLPNPQKGNTPVSVPIGTSAPVIPASTGAYPTFDENVGSGGNYGVALGGSIGVADVFWQGGTSTATQRYNWADSGLIADLTSATAATINQLRQSFQIQKLLERDSRGGTRYTEIVRSHFGVASPDGRMMRPEYLGGSTTPINIHPIAQTSASGLTGGATELGSLAAFGTALSQNNGFTASFVEHGIILGLVSVRADLTYQQGLHKMWSRETRYDFYFPAFAYLGEQAVLNKEIYCDGSANDDAVFGYQERWSEYRYKPSQISSLFKSTASGTIDAWHLAQNFAQLPTLNASFIEDNPPLSRVLAVGSSANGQQFIFDGFFNNKVARPMPMYSVPGLIDHL